MTVYIYLYPAAQQSWDLALHRWVQRSQAAHKLHTHPTSQRAEKAWQAAPNMDWKNPYFGKKNQKKAGRGFVKGKKKNTVASPVRQMIMTKSQSLQEFPEYRACESKLKTHHQIIASQTTGGKGMKGLLSPSSFLSRSQDQVLTDIRHSRRKSNCFFSSVIHRFRAIGQCWFSLTLNYYYYLNHLLQNSCSYMKLRNHLFAAKAS